MAKQKTAKQKTAKKKSGGFNLKTLVGLEVDDAKKQAKQAGFQPTTSEIVNCVFRPNRVKLRVDDEGIVREAVQG